MLVMKRLLTFLLAVPMTFGTLSAQEVITTDELAQNVSTYTADNYMSYVENQRAITEAKYELNVPSLECNNSACRSSLLSH